jgi:phosphate-selective porin
MRIARTFTLLLAVACIALGARAQSSGKNSPDEPARPGTANTAAPVAKTGDAAPAKATAPVAATREEVEQLRMEVAELKAVISRLLEAKAQPAPAASPAAATVAVANAAPAPNAVAGQPGVPAEVAAEPDAAEPFGLLQDKKDQKPAGVPVTAGFNGEHFFIKSPDGKFQLQPYGYVQTDYRSFSGDGAPANAFSVRRARFGFQGNYGSHVDYGILTDTVASTGATIRDVYINMKYNPELQVQAGQFKEPFAQELAAGVTNIDFVERGLQSLLYPSASSAFRSPGFAIHGDINGGVVQYWGGIFNGKGYATANTTNVPETVGRIRVYPWRKHKDSLFQGLALGGSIAYSVTRGLSNETTLVTCSPDGAYCFFPQFRVNGGVWRYEAEYTYLHGPFATRGEYVQAMYSRNSVGTEQLGGLGIESLPQVRFKAYNIAATYMLTGEKRPENGTPRVKHPLLGPETPGGSGGKGWGAWEVALRYSGIHGNEPGVFFNNVFTPENVPTFNQKTDQFTLGVNWYLNYWVRYQTNFILDRLQTPSTIGAQRQDYYVFEQRLQFRF